MKFEAVRILYLNDVFGLLSFKNFATMATWRNDFSSLQDGSESRTRIRVIGGEISVNFWSWEMKFSSN